jgi:dienelactone hydrolase
VAWTRRQVLKATIGLGVPPLAGCAKYHASVEQCCDGAMDFETVPICGFTVLRIGPESGKSVLLLHEIPGLSPTDLALARCLAKEGFNVHAPLLFGTPGQNSVFKGYRAACRPSLFECSKLKARSAILDKLEPMAECLATRAAGPIGAIGMCLTGILPLALLPNKVEAAVLCQPTLPFSFWHGRPTGDQLTDLGLGQEDLIQAEASPTPFLAMHYAADKRSPVGRMQALQTTFPKRVAVISLCGEHGHSSLAGDFNFQAFEDTITYLRVRLGVGKGAAANEDRDVQWPRVRDHY